MGSCSLLRLSLESDFQLSPAPVIVSNGEKKITPLHVCISGVNLSVPNYSCFQKGCPAKLYVAILKGIMGIRRSCSLIEALGVGR